MNQPKRRQNKQSGQGLLEYALMVLVMLAMFRIMDYRIRKGIGGMWKYLAQNVAAGCPVPSAGQGCTNSVPEELK